MGTVLTRLGLELHPEKTRLVDLSWGHEGFDFLGCHLRKRLSGPIWERSRQRVYFLQRWPSQRAMRQVRTRVRDLTPRGRCHEDLRTVIADVNRGGARLGAVLSDGQRGDALHPARPLRRGPAARASAQAARLSTDGRAGPRRGVVPSSRPWDSAASAAPSSIRGRHNAAPRPTTGKPCAGNPHARFERGSC